MLIEQFNPLEDKMIQVMDENGEIVNADLMPDLKSEEILELYKTMLKARTIDSAALSLQRQDVYKRQMNTSLHQINDICHQSQLITVSDICQ